MKENYHRRKQVVQDEYPKLLYSSEIGEITKEEMRENAKKIWQKDKKVRKKRGEMNIPRLLRKALEERTNAWTSQTH